MARQRYSKKESWNRILRSWQGKVIPSDIPGTLSGEILSEDEALSDFAELCEGSLPGENGTVPSNISATGTVIRADEYGQIYQDGQYITTYNPTGTYQKLSIFETGSYSSDLIVNDYPNNRIQINAIGIYFVDFNLSASAAADGTYIVHAAVNGERKRQIGSIFQPLTVVNTGTYSMAGTGIIEVPAVPAEIDLRILADNTGSFRVSHASLSILKAA